MYKVGGDTSAAADKKVFKIMRPQAEDEEFQFIEKASIKKKRYSHSLCWFGQNFIVVTGGSLYSNLATCELYNTQTE